MSKTLQFMFIFFVVIITGVGVYFGMAAKGDIDALYKRMADLETQNNELRSQIDTLMDFTGKGTGKIVKNEVDLSKFPGGKPSDKNLKPKLSKGFYCDTDNAELAVVQFYEDGTFKFWNVSDKEVATFNKNKAHSGKGNYLIHGMELYATFNNGVLTQKRVLNILSMGNDGTVLQLHGSRDNFMTVTCPSQLQSF